MTINRTVHNKDNPYTMLNTSIAFDNRISGLAKAMWLYAFSRPDDWTFYSKEMRKHMKEGRDACDTALRQLEEFGYLERKRERLPNGKFKVAAWVWYEVSQIMLPKPGNQETVNQDPDNPQLPIIDSIPSIKSSKQENAAAVDLRSEEKEAVSEAVPNAAGQQSKNSNIESSSSAATPPVPPPPPWVVREVGQESADNLAKTASYSKYDLGPMESRFIDQREKGFTTGPVAWLLAAVRGNWQPKTLRPTDSPVTPRLNADTDYIFDVYDRALHKSRMNRPHLARIIKEFARNRRQGIIQIYRDCDIVDTPLAFSLINPEELESAKALLKKELPKLQSGK